MFTIDNPNWRELAAAINSMGLLDQSKPVELELAAPSFISHKLRPRLVGCTSGLSIKLDITSGMIIPSSMDVAEFACEVAEIALTQSQQPEILDRWDWYDKTIGQGSEVSFESKGDAAMDAIRTRYPLSDWARAVSDGDTEVGYVHWALSEALSEASDRACGIEPTTIELVAVEQEAIAQGDVGDTA